MNFCALATKHLGIGLLVNWSLQHKFQKRSKNDLCVIKQILFDMGPLTLVRWPLYSSS